MTTDREMLEMAAKAAGWTGWRSKHGYWNVESPEGDKQTCCTGWEPYDRWSGEKLPEPTFADALSEAGWSPLTDYSDAMELSVMCGISIMHYPVFSMPKHSVVATHYREIDPLGENNPTECIELYGENAVLATCMAIVRVAAEIGRAMK